MSFANSFLPPKRGKNTEYVSTEEQTFYAAYFYKGYCNTLIFKRIFCVGFQPFGGMRIFERFQFPALSNSHFESYSNPLQLLIFSLIKSFDSPVKKLFSSRRMTNPALFRQI